MAAIAALVVAAVGALGCGGGDASAPGMARPDLAARADVPVLCYHQIRAATAADDDGARRYIISPELFARQMRALADAGYRTITGDQLVAHVDRGAPLPAKPVLLTFDDASAGQFTSALPVLRRHRFVATFFLPTAVLDKAGWLTRDQVRALDRAGMTIGAHTRDHRAVPEYAGDDWEAQLETPRDDLATLVGHPIRLFAYPYGQWSAEAFDHLAEAGYTGAFQLAGPLDLQHPLWTLRRILVPATSGGDLVAAMRRSFSR